MTNEIKKSLTDLLAQRREIERQVSDKHSQRLAILFTDIVGSTQYFESHGNIEGMSMVERHNGLLFPMVEQHHGRIVKTIGDAIMAVFADAPDAVYCAAAMQQALARHRNESHENPIHVRIGAHVGTVLVKADSDFDVFGDAVNTAARIESKAESDEILLSQELFESLPASSGMQVVPRESLSLKGKANPLPVVSLRWGDKTPVASQPSVGQVAASGSSEQAPEIFSLELQLGANGLKCAAIDGSDEKGTVKSYAEVAVESSFVDELAQQFEAFLNGGAESYLERIRELGAESFTSCLAPETRRKLIDTRQLHLRIQAYDELAHVPWELLHDGSEFLCLRFAVGRLVAAKAQRRAKLYAATLDSSGHALVVSNPSGDLNHAAREGKAVTGLLEEGFAGAVRHLQGPCNKGAFFEALPGTRLLHFAGHAMGAGPSGVGGFQFADGFAAPSEVVDACKGDPPALVFVNSCYAASDRKGWVDDGRQRFDLATALLLEGVPHYLGPMGNIPDQDALSFALRFWENVLSAQSYGESVRQARLSLAHHAAESISFARYVLYGDPRQKLAKSSARLDRSPKRSADESLPSFPVVLPRAASCTRSSVLLWGVVVGVAVVGFAILFGRQPGVETDTGEKAPALQPSTEIAEPSGRSKAAVAPRSGPIRISILPFRNVGKSKELEFLSGGLAETIITDFGTFEDLQLVERMQLENKEIDRSGLMALDILGEIEFGQSKFVDESTAATLGKIKGTEVVLVGGFQGTGGRVRATGRFVDVETGRVLHTVKVEKPANALFDLQDEVAKAAKEGVASLRKQLRPGGAVGKP